MIARDRQKVFQMQVKQLMSGLTVVERRGKVQLKLRGKDQPTQTILLPFDWGIKSFDDAYTRIRNIFKFITEGHNLKAAAELAQGKAPKKGKDWAHILESFKDQKINFGTAITEATFNKQYLPPCEMVVDVMSKKNPPTNPADLIDICVKDWKPQSVSRKHRVRAIKQFLDHAVNREGIADIIARDLSKRKSRPQYRQSDAGSLIF